MSRTDHLARDILAWMETLPDTLGATHIEQVDAKISQFDPARQQDALSGLLWEAVDYYRNEHRVSYIQLARRVAAAGLEPGYMASGNRCGYADLYQVLVLPPEHLTAPAIDEFYALYGDFIDAKHAIDGDPKGGYGGVHFLVMLHSDHPDHVMSTLARAEAAGFDLDQRDSVQETPLLALVSRSDYPGRNALIQALLDIGADPMATSSGGRNCWLSAGHAERPFELMDRLAAHTPHARRHGALGAEEIKSIMAVASGAGDYPAGRLLATWLQDRLLQSQTPMQGQTVSRPGPRL